VLFAFFKVKQGRMERIRTSLNQQVGEMFPLLPLLDTTASQVTPDWSQEITIIDFWYKNCPGCIEEMMQFEEVLKGKEAAVSIISISIDAYEDWKALMDGHDQRLSFITKPVTNWQHLLLKVNNGPYSRGINSQHLSQKLAVMGYPSFFVVDKKGIIQATPESAVAYIQATFDGENKFIQFLKSPDTWTSYYMIFVLLGSFVLYLLLGSLLMKFIHNSNGAGPNRADNF